MYTTYNTTETTRIPLRRGDGHIVGYIENSVAHKTVKKSKHFHRARQAWCLDVETFHQCKTYAHTIVLHEKQESVDYVITTEDFNRLKDKPFDEGFGLQYPLKIAHWQAKQHPLQLKLVEVGN